MNRVLAIAILALAPLEALAASGWKLDGDVSVSAAYDTNAFNLSDSQQDRVDAESAVDEATGRIRDMESVDDFVTTVSAGMSVSMPDTGFSILPSFAYHRYAMNGEKSFPELGIALRKELADDSSLELELEYELDSFKKNYLADTTVGTGTVVLPSERVYERGVYDELSVEAAYKRTLWSGPRRVALRKVDAEIAAGYSQREFEGPLANHDLDTWEVGFEVGTRFGESLRLELSYGYAQASAPGEDEVVIVDEPSVGVDLNFDLDTNDLDVAALAAVDRSRSEHAPAIKAKLDLPHHADAWLGYGYRSFDYDSDEALDLSYRGRTDHEHAFNAGVRWRFAKHWKATFAAEHSWRDSNKSASLLGDEEGTKSGSIVYAGLSWDY